MSKEIDFDELDKAVTSLMGSVGTKDKEEERKENTYTVSSTLKPGEKPSYDKLEEVAKKIGSETLLTDSERSIVNDLDSGTREPDANADTIKTVEIPSTIESEPEREQESEPPQLPIERPKAPKAPRPSGGRFMDVVHPSSDMKTTNGELPVVTPRVEPGDIPVPARPKPSVSDAPSVTTDEPLTPFLPDAKVEKRPLGAPLDTVSHSEPERSASIPEVPESPDAAENQEGPSEPAEAMPINSEATAKEQRDPQTVLDASSFENATPDISAEVSAVESSEIDPTIAKLQSIESNDTGQLKTDASEGSIFAVDAHPQPLAHPSKQKSGWGTVVIIILIVILAAALGAAAYFILGLGV